MRINGLSSKKPIEFGILKVPKNDIGSRPMLAFHMSTVFERFRSSAHRWGDADFLYVEEVTAQTYGIAAGPIAWSSALAQVEELHRAYAVAGYGHGHRVGLLMENRPAFLLHWLALNGLGVSVVPINVEMRAAELAYLIDHSEIALAVVLPQRVEALQAAVMATGAQTRVVDMHVHQFPPPRHAGDASHAANPRDRVCVALHIGHYGAPQGLSALERLFPAHR